MATHSSILAWKIPMDRGAWWATVHGVARSWTQLSDQTRTHAPFLIHSGLSANLLPPNRLSGASHPVMLQPLTVLFSVQSDLTCVYLSLLSQDNEKSNHKAEFIAQITRRAVLAKRTGDWCHRGLWKAWNCVIHRCSEAGLTSGGYSGKVHVDWQVIWTASLSD